jgi:DNA-binding transcriptional MerR regulator
MFKIGDFSRLTQVTVKALRHYDRIGLLKPASIDPESGYRYYTSSQLPRLNRIVALKDLGFSLEQVGQLLDAELAPEQLRSMLLQKQDEVREQIDAEQARLARIETRLRQLEEGSAARYDVVVKSVEAQRIISLRGLLPGRSAIGQLFRELHANLRRHGINGTTNLTIWHDADYRDEEVDAEAAVVSDARVPESGPLIARELPAVATMACVVHHGSPETIGDGCQALLQWIEANGYRLDGPERVVLLQRGKAGWNDAVAEMQYPIAALT